VVSFGQQMGVTFPLLMRGYQTSVAYGAQKNYIYLIDKNGIVQAISMLPATTVSYAHIDSAVKVIADKIPALLNAAVRYWKIMSASQTALPSNNYHAYDVRGRMVGVVEKVSAFQPVLLWNGNKQTPAMKVLPVERR
jgi:hypothetical protein